jgi:amino-acid N-acetyltransferase
MTTIMRQAQPEDVPQIVEMVNRFAAQNLMLPRTGAAVFQSLSNWLVAVMPATHEGQEAAPDKGTSPGGKADPQAPPDSQYKVVGCGSLVTLTDKLAEIRSLAVHESLHGQSLGTYLVEHLIALARAREYEQVCALTLRESFFVRMGFQVVDRWSISPKLWQECIYCPKFHRCDEIAVLMNLTGEPVEESLVDTSQPAAWNHLLKWSAWQPLKLAYSRRPIHLDDEDE